MSDKVVIKFSNVTKQYKLFKNDKQRFKSIFTRKKLYKTKYAVNNLSFEIKKGESVAFFGRNGAGKSTVLKMITGVTFPTEGEILVDGRVSALLELTAGFDPEFTGRENIYFRGQLFGMTDEEIRALEPEIIAFADIGDYIDQPVRTYSSGMKARLGFAINANVDPEILIVDEALSVGDQNFSKKCTEKIRQLVTDNEVTFLFVTHSANTAKQFCDKGIVMKDGSLMFQGDIDGAIAEYRKILNG
ncbi:MAG: ABC transporter ATP-binding protein [Firmicutes bacterium]|nr:ABC transporter ATP-binding protein [Bacillota bacterium]